MNYRFSVIVCDFVIIIFTILTQLIRSVSCASGSGEEVVLDIVAKSG